MDLKCSHCANLSECRVDHQPTRVVAQVEGIEEMPDSHGMSCETYSEWVTTEQLRVWGEAIEPAQEISPEMAAAIAAFNTGRV